MNVLGQAISCESIDDALKLVHEALGIEDGGCAGMFFGYQRRKKWLLLTRQQRTTELGMYLQAEINHAYWDMVYG